MKPKKLLSFSFVVLGVALLFAPWPVGLTAQQNNGGAVRIDADDIGGVVTGANGPEAGVWVIAETTELPTKFTKIVVTDDQGRYVMPDLPKASYSVWVRGYGLVDSPKVKAVPGKILNLKAVPAPSEAAAAEYYPAIYWYSMLKIPDKNEFPVGKIATQNEWLNVAKTNGCITSIPPPKRGSGASCPDKP
ncbi:MAG: carboxypeptidase regulatory-like domain-containing protein [Deltaproteobacteria bacterium]|nr:MAG: carboxypeptidase regulatory-like domain-containing protein [Deltaproteobacteria bacterium]